MNGELAGEMGMGTSFGLEPPTLSNNFDESPPGRTPPNENNAAAAAPAKNPSQQPRPTELIPVHTLVTNVGGGQATVVTKMSSNDAVSSVARCGAKGLK